MIQVVTPEWLFKCAAVTPGGIIDWGQKVPERGPGVYIITATDPPEGGQPVVYIGRTKHLRKRLSQFYKHDYGKRSPHRGGQKILLLSGSLIVRWAPVADYPAAEKAMLEGFRKIVGTWPFGNLKNSDAKVIISN